MANGGQDGPGNRQIAARLGVSAGTIKTHVSRIFKRLRANDRISAVFTGPRMQLVEGAESSVPEET